MKKQQLDITVILAICGMLLLNGCGSGAPSDTPDMGTVTGTVTLDGAPLKEALVQFSPESGRGSVATTDEAGNYELIYTDSLMGAKVGKHIVRITTFKAPEGNLEENKDQQPVQKELVPPQYNKQSTLSVDVKEGANTFDFELKSK